MWSFSEHENTCFKLDSITIYSWTGVSYLLLCFFFMEYHLGTAILHSGSDLRLLGKASRRSRTTFIIMNHSSTNYKWCWHNFNSPLKVRLLPVSNFWNDSYCKSVVIYATAHQTLLIYRALHLKMIIEYLEMSIHRWNFPTVTGKVNGSLESNIFRKARSSHSLLTIPFGKWFHLSAFFPQLNRDVVNLI